MCVCVCVRLGMGAHRRLTVVMVHGQLVMVMGPGFLAV